MEEIDYRKGDWEPADFDGDPYGMIVFSSRCFRCVYYQDWEGYAPVCKAFPKGIIPEIWRGQMTHDQPIEGDHGYQFKEKTE